VGEDRHVADGRRIAQGFHERAHTDRLYQSGRKPDTCIGP
jgi:hypothetical protein